MLMNRAFFLACATAVTLGVAAASSTSAYARPCSNADSVDEERSCLIRNAMSHARAAAAEAAEAAEFEAFGQRLNGQNDKVDAVERGCENKYSDVELSEKGIRR